GPRVNTKEANNSHELPQMPSQAAIFRQLDRWIGKKELNEVFAEGCSGQLDAQPTFKINGWTLADLEAAKGRPDYAEILTSVPLKLEAKYGASLHAVCGDDESLVKDGNLALSDIRGTVGFITRLKQYRNDPIRARPYLDGVVKLYKLPKSTSTDEAIIRLKSE